MYQVTPGNTPPDQSKQTEQGPQSADWLSIAQQAYEQSTSYVESNLRREWEKAIYAFQSRHAPDSKYNSEAFRHRSKLYRPKTRSVIRKIEAAACAAFFSNVEVIDAHAVNDADKKQVASAAVIKGLIQYRLTKSIPWFQVLIGGVQDAATMGAVCSYQYWNYKKVKTSRTEDVMDEVSGQPMLGDDGKPLRHTYTKEKIVRDEPCVELVPLENLRIDPAADWLDPIQSSPYVIRLVPMYVSDVKQMMRTTDDKTGLPKWKKASDAVIRSASTRGLDSTRMARQNRQADPNTEAKVEVADFDMVWVHQNFIRKNGEEWVYWTLGTEFLLTTPEPLEEVYHHNERPFVMGCAVLETHKTYPTSMPGLVDGPQKEINEIVNQRLDNVKLVLNKHFVVKRGAQVDLRSLVRNVPGGVTMATDPEKDVREMSFNDVTGSSFQEQDRLNMDFDAIAGDFNPAQMPHGRKGADTVRGMQMLSSSSNQQSEYLLRTITVTWIERVLRQLVKLEQAYETDEVVLAIAADKAQLLQRYGMDKVTDDLLNQELTITVNVGMGATDPNLKLQKLHQGIQMVSETMANPVLPATMKSELVKETFSLLGYPDAKRFMGDNVDPTVAQLEQQLQQAQQTIQQLQQAVQGKQLEHDAKVKQSAIQADSNQQVARLNLIGKQLEIEHKGRVETMKVLEQRMARVQQAKENRGRPAQKKN